MKIRFSSSFAPLSLAALTLACAANPSAATPPSEPTDRAPSASAPKAPSATSDETAHTEIPSAPEAAPGDKPTQTTESRQDELRVGEVTDGANLTSIEVEKFPLGVYKLVLAFDGKGRPPVVRSRVENPRLVVLIVEGVRGVTANLPVVSGEGGTRLREPRAVNRGPVKSLGRGFYGDDSGIRIDVELSSLPGLSLVEGTKGRTVELVMDPKN